MFTTFIQQYAAGLTPNPDILCNRFVKFGYLWEHAQALGADRLATGHYAAVGACAGAAAGECGGELENAAVGACVGGQSAVGAYGCGTGGSVRLMRPRDEVKDQTYFLCQVCMLPQCVIGCV